MIPSYYDNCTGQKPAAQKLSFWAEAFRSSKIYPNAMFLAPKGAGKTHFARRTAAVLHSIAKAEHGGQPKYFEEYNCAAIKDLRSFAPVFIKRCETNCTLFFDEIHSLPDDVVDWLLTALNPEKIERPVKWGSISTVFDARRTTVIAATTERHKVFEPLLNRFQIVEFIDYSLSEIASIIRSHLEAGYDSDCIMALADMCRGNARSAVDMAREIDRYAEVFKVPIFDKSHMQELIRILDIFPKGLSRPEVNLLKSIAERGTASLTALCAETGLTRAAQQQFESYLLRNRLMEILPNSKRVVTNIGAEYLRSIGITSIAVPDMVEPDFGS